MAFCGKCGAQLHENAAFCANCGASTAGGSAQTTAAGGTPMISHPAVAAGAPQQRGFWSALFDISFSTFVTTKLVKVLFVLAIIGAGIYAIGIIVLSNNRALAIDPALGIVLAPIAFFVIVLLARVYMEVIVVTFRGVEYLRELVEQGRNRDKS